MLYFAIANNIDTVQGTSYTDSAQGKGGLLLPFLNRRTLICVRYLF